jgi:hypothetical protein
MRPSKTTFNVVAMFCAVALSVAAPAAAQRRNPSGGGSRDSGSGGGGDRAVPRGSSGGGDQSPRSSGGGTSTASAPSSASDSQGDRSGGSTAGSRPRSGQTSTGTAVPRRGTPPSSGAPIVIDSGGYYTGYYPWGYGGYGYGGYYGGYYDPWYYGGGYGGYGGGYGGGYYRTGYEGSLRLKMKPRDASVFVDGYYAGTVDEFDGVFQRLRIESGPHRIEVRADGYQPLSFEIRILPGRTINYSGDLKPARP